MINSKVLIAFFLLQNGVLSCKVFKGQDYERKETIKKAIAAIKSADSLDTYFLFDTAYLFQIKGKEGFKAVIAKAKEHLRNCDIQFERLSTEKLQFYESTNYLLPLCDDSIKLMFRFSDVDHQTLIGNFDIKFKDVNKLIQPPKMVDQ